MKNVANAPMAWSTDSTMMKDYQRLKDAKAKAAQQGASGADLDAYRDALSTFKADAASKGLLGTVTAGSNTLQAVIEDAEGAVENGKFDAARAQQDITMMYSQYGNKNDAVGDTLSANSRTTTRVDFATQAERDAFAKAWARGNSPFAKALIAANPKLSSWGSDPKTWNNDAWANLASSTPLFVGNKGVGDLMVVNPATGEARAFAATDGTALATENYAYGDKNDAVNNGFGAWKGGGDVAVFVYRGTDGKFTVQSQEQLADKA